MSSFRPAGLSILATAAAMFLRFGFISFFCPKVEFADDAVSPLGLSVGYCLDASALAGNETTCVTWAAASHFVAIKKLPIMS